MNRCCLIAALCNCIFIFACKHSPGAEDNVALRASAHALIADLRENGQPSDEVYATAAKDETLRIKDILAVAEVDLKTGVRLVRNRGLLAEDMEQLSYWLLTDIREKVSTEAEAVFIASTYALWPTAGFNDQHRPEIHTLLTLAVQRSLLTFVENQENRHKVLGFIKRAELQVGTTFKAYKLVPVDSPATGIRFEFPPKAGEDQ